MRALREAEHRLPVAADGHRPVGGEAAGPVARRCVIWRVCPGVRPCHERISNHCAPRAAAGGSSVTATSTAPGPARCGTTAARVPSPPVRGSGIASATRTAAAADATTGAGIGRGPPAGSGERERLADPRPEHRAADARGERERQRGGEHRRRPRVRHPDGSTPIGREADRPDARAGGEGERERAAGEHERRDLDDRRLGDVQREARRRVAHGGRRRTAPARRGSRGTSRAPGTRPTGRAATARRRARTRRERDQHRLEQELELRHAGVELGLERRQADESARVTGRDPPRRPPWPPDLETLADDHPQPERAQPGAADHPRWVGPHSVTSSPNRACQVASSGNPISATDPHRSRTTPPGLSRSPARDRGRRGRLPRRTACRSAAKTMPCRPRTIRPCGTVRTAWSRPWSTW